MICGATYGVVYAFFQKKWTHNAQGKRRWRIRYENSSAFDEVPFLWCCVRFFHQKSELTTHHHEALVRYHHTKIPIKTMYTLKSVRWANMDCMLITMSWYQRFVKFKMYTFRGYFVFFLHKSHLKFFLCQSLCVFHKKCALAWISFYSRTRAFEHRTLDGDYQCLIMWSVVKAV